VARNHQRTQPSILNHFGSFHTQNAVSVQSNSSSLVNRI
jgi:hypothetical protein